MDDLKKKIRKKEFFETHESKVYSCDGGCILILLNGGELHIENGIGDGDYNVCVAKKGEDLNNIEYQYVGFISGHIQVLSMDFRLEYGDTVLFDLEGTYSILRADGDIILNEINFLNFCD